MDSIFEEEQHHLQTTYGKLLAIEQQVREQLEQDLSDALSDKEDLFDEMALDLDADIRVETLAELEAMNRIIEGYNLSADINQEKLRRVQLLLRRPYFAKIRCRFPHSDEPKDIYIGAAGMTDESRRHFIVDWRSPIAEVYYNQSNGATSYDANGRTIQVDLQLRRQFDIERDKLNAYFDTTVAIEDPLLLESLSKRRTASLQAITTTIQKEQNTVIRHEDVPVLLVSGIAGSGKTSVLLQRIAYLFYTERDNLRPDDVYLITPNPVFGRYIDNVLPDMGERNPQILTWNDLMEKLGLAGRGVSREASIETLDLIDSRIPSLSLDQNDFCDIRIGTERVISAASARSSLEKFSYLPMGVHRFTLAIEDMKEKLEQRILRLARDLDYQDELSDLPVEEQIRLFGQQITPIGDDEIVERTEEWLRIRYSQVEGELEDGAWLKFDRIGMRLTGKQTLDASEWLYLRLALIGSGQRDARYVMIDEVQDYTPSQLRVLARYFPNAHFLLLGDENQAIDPATATFAEIKAIFEGVFGKDCVSVCELMCSYRSSPEITSLFVGLMDESERVKATSVQRPGIDPVVIECLNAEDYDAEIVWQVRQAAESSSSEKGLTALIANTRTRAKQLAKLVEGENITIMAGGGSLPDSGVILLDVKLAKGLEFDEVIIPDVHQGAFPDEPLRRHRLYTAISRATKKVTLIGNGPLCNLLQK